MLPRYAADPVVQAYLAELDRAYGVRVEGSGELAGNLRTVRRRLRLTREQAAEYVTWWFRCYSRSEPPIHPFALEHGYHEWVAFKQAASVIAYRQALDLGEIIRQVDMEGVE
jgi:hypothetical protein